MKIPTNQFRTGTKILLDGAPCTILSHEFHKPGKGQAVVRIKYRNLLSGNVIEKTFKSNESVEDENNDNFSINESKLSDEIERLNQLLNDGILTQEEFEKAKKKLLDN